MLARRLPENAHLIVAGRDEFLPPQEVLRLERHVWRIGAAQLRLEREELEAYARRCGAELSDHQVEQLLHTTEGCVFCGLCAKKCPYGALSVDRQTKQWRVSDRRCRECGLCAAACPKHCLSLDNSVV